MLRRLTCQDVPPPPPGAEMQEPEQPSAQPLRTTGEYFAWKTSMPQCASCHTVIRRRHAHGRSSRERVLAPPGAHHRRPTGDHRGRGFGVQARQLRAAEWEQGRHCRGHGRQRQQQPPAVYRAERSRHAHPELEQRRRAARSCGPQRLAFVNPEACSGSTNALTGPPGTSRSGTALEHVEPPPRRRIADHGRIDTCVAAEQKPRQGARAGRAQLGALTVAGRGWRRWHICHTFELGRAHQHVQTPACGPMAAHGHVLFLVATEQECREASRTVAVSRGAGAIPLALWRGRHSLHAGRPQPGSRLWLRMRGCVGGLRVAPAPHDIFDHLVERAPTGRQKGRKRQSGATRE